MFWVWQLEMEGGLFEEGLERGRDQRTQQPHIQEKDRAEVGHHRAMPLVQPVQAQSRQRSGARLAAGGAPWPGAGGEALALAGPALGGSLANTSCIWMSAFWIECGKDEFSTNSSVLCTDSSQV